MMEFKVAVRRKNPAYEVKAVIKIGRQAEGRDDDENPLDALRDKLEHTIPASYKAKYEVVQNELLVKIKALDMAQGQGLTRRLTDFIKSAAKALNM